MLIVYHRKRNWRKLAYWSNCIIKNVTENDGSKIIDYPKVPALLVEAIKEQQQQVTSNTSELKSLTDDFKNKFTVQQESIDSLKKENETQQDQISSLQQQLDSLKKEIEEMKKL
jgi:peptidoglycan hydrolase CwlO-like protein